jgi:hypothetical protein
MRKFVVSVILLIIVGGVAFYFGWIQFRIPEGSHAVVFTKTKGYESQAIPAGEFAWRWEALIPTNLKLHIYSDAPYTTSISSRGSLPSASIYRQELEEAPSFEYSLRIRVGYRFAAERLPELLEEESITPEGLNEWYAGREEAMKQQILGIVSENLEAIAESQGIASVTAELSPRIEESLEEIFPFLVVTSVVPQELTLPDLRLYRRARDLYFARLDARSEAIATVGVDTASRQIEQESRVARLERYGSVLAQYPSLLEYFNLLAENGFDPLNIQELGIAVPSQAAPQGQ